jgi:hypothetical protein
MMRSSFYSGIHHQGVTVNENTAHLSLSVLPEPHREAVAWVRDSCTRRQDRTFLLLFAFIVLTRLKHHRQAIARPHRKPHLGYDGMPRNQA